MFTQVIASLVNQKLVKVTRISQDGTRVRACAGSGSYRSEDRLGELLAEAKAHVDELSKLLDDPPSTGSGQAEKSAGLSAKKKAARKRAAREKVERIEAAVAKLPELKQKQAEAAEQAPSTSSGWTGNGAYGKKLKAGKPRLGVARRSRVSTTDATRLSSSKSDARVMKMADGGFRPAVNVQLAVDTQSRAIIGLR